MPCASEAPQLSQTSSSVAFSVPQSGHDTVSGTLQPGQRGSPVDSAPQLGQVIVATDDPCARARARENRGYSNASPSRESSSSA